MNDFTLFLPEFMVTGLAFLVLAADLSLPAGKKGLLPYLAAAGLAAILAFSLVDLRGQEGSIYEGMLVVDGYALFFKAFFLVLGIVVVLSSVEYVKRHLEYPGEYYGILLFTVVAAMLLAASRELLTAYISLELLSFGLYVLVAYDRYNPKSNEGGTKYILLGALSSAFLLYGISQIYGLVGTTRFDGISEVLAATSDMSPGVVVGLVMIIAGLGFKVAAVPFHMWAPDAYEGAPIPITAYLAVGSKAAAFALVLRLFGEALIPAAADWQIVIVILAALTMVVGNLGALVQRNIKRLLAYSSVGHVGYLLMGIAALAAVDADGGVSTELSHLASNGVMLHLVAYGITNMAAFLAVAAMFNVTGSEEVSSLAGSRPAGSHRGRGNGGCPLLAGRSSYIRRLREQVLPVQRGGFSRPSMAGWTGDFHQPDLALLLSDGRAADVHRARRGPGEGAHTPGYRRSAGAAVRRNGGGRRVPGPAVGCDTVCQRRVVHRQRWASRSALDRPFAFSIHYLHHFSDTWRSADDRRESI